MRALRRLTRLERRSPRHKVWATISAIPSSPDGRVPTPEEEEEAMRELTPEEWEAKYCRPAETPQE
jgi:hypothetical protein